MKLVIPQVQVGRNSARQINGGQIEQRCEVLFMGGKAVVTNSKNVLPGVYSEVTVEVEVKSEAKAWAAKDGRKGTLIGTEITFGEILEATPAKK